jgi:hypothetical protein
MHTQQQAYIEGFTKRASEYGFTQNEAIELLKSSGIVDATPTDYNYIISNRTEKPTPAVPSGKLNDPFAIRTNPKITDFDKVRDPLIGTDIRKTINNVGGKAMTGLYGALGQGDPYADLKSRRATSLPLRADLPSAQPLPSSNPPAPASLASK